MSVYVYVGEDDSERWRGEEKVGGAIEGAYKVTEADPSVLA